MSLATQANLGDQSPGGAQVLLRAQGIAKTFGATHALRDCSFELAAGEVHALVGENGSGKSTFVKIVSGIHRPDSGTLEVGDEPLDGFRSTRAAQLRGIFTVFQEVLVADARSVFDNVWLGAEGLLRGQLDASAKTEQANEVLAALLGHTLPLSTAVEDLSLSDRQACCIARAVLRRPRILILDEATSALDVATRDRLFALIRGLAADGVGVVFISHRMDELREIGDRITVMRSGETVARLARHEWSADELVRLMTGADHLTAHARGDAAESSLRLGPPVLRAAGDPTGEHSGPVFELRAGEVVGLGGLEGHGQETFLKALGGLSEGTVSVARIDGATELPVDSPFTASEHGIAYVPRERALDSLFGWMSIRENFALPTLVDDSRRGFLRVGQTKQRLAEYVSRLGIVIGGQDDRITTLSGGNQQKVIIARWLATKPRVLLLNDPTRGIDIGAKRDFYALLGELALEGVSVVMLSTEVDELVELMDRVLVFREGSIDCEIERESLSRQSLVRAFFGRDEPAASRQEAGTDGTV